MNINLANACTFQLIKFSLFSQQGGLGALNYPLLADFNKTISADYDVLLKEEGVALRYISLLFCLSALPKL